ncbi:hypothetical protein IW262DRAFT_1548206 [Armillaria fumosa]|nr:hypothetical protein IW262DRAFT_1548206 [Armillaria fumosa]
MAVSRSTTKADHELGKLDSTFLSIHGWRYIFLFGGYDGTEINSKLIAINVNTKVWSVVPIEGTVAPRIDAAMVGIEDRLYIFGGRQRFEHGNTVFFHCKHCAFQSASETEGVFPMGLHWYFAHTIEALPPVSNPGLPARGRRPIEFVPAPPPVDPYAIICGWVASPFSNDDSYLVPELYRYVLPPVQEVECLDMKQKLWELELNLQSFIAVGRKLYMFGHDDSDETDAHTVYTVCVELDTQERTAR